MLNDKDWEVNQQSNDETVRVIREAVAEQGAEKFLVDTLLENLKIAYINENGSLMDLPIILAHILTYMDFMIMKENLIDLFKDCLDNPHDPWECSINQCVENKVLMKAAVWVADREVLLKGAGDRMRFPLS